MDRNKYVCQKCKRSIVTRHDNVGTTPFMLKCRATLNCDGMMQSQFGRVSPLETATHEWFRREDLERMSPPELEHHLKGGAFIRRIDVEPPNPEQRKKRINPFLRMRRHRR